MRILRVPGFTSYAVVALWFLVTIGQTRADHSTDAKTPLDVIVEAAIADKGAPDGAVISIDYDASLITDDFDPLTAQVNGASFNETAGRFVLRMKNETSDGGGVAVIVGEAAVMTAIPVLRTNLPAGAQISAADVEWATVKDNRRDRFIQSPERLIGKTVRRAIAAGKPIRPNELAAAFAIKKGEMVTLLIEMPGMRLTNRGIALSRGEIGDPIDVRNLNGEQVVNGVIVGNGVVRTGAAPGVNSRRQKRRDIY